MKKLITFLFALGLIIPSGMASAESSSENNVDYNRIAEHMKNDGASQEAIDNVIRKLKNGEELDSDKSENRKSLTLSRAQLQSTLSQDNEESENGENDSVSTTDTEPNKTFTFDDGSYVKLSIKEDIDNTSIKALGGTMSTMSTTGKTITVKGSSIWYIIK
ncbi:hypothetical protein P4606_21645 [Priestia aryabhattai]|uniref:hypothetical protein n=1 Tax=Priestia aryabhattai TaxID=412384 RepID=UPI002E1A98C7|nr:hypothetical protein [Priestia aryabhattai]